MSPRTAGRVTLGLACALALSLHGRFLLDQLRARGQVRDESVESWLAAVARLPAVPEAATVGFVTTVDPDHWEARLFLTRYALAPRTVLRGAGEPWVVGHFRSQEEADALARAAGFSVLGRAGELSLLGSPAP